MGGILGTCFFGVSILASHLQPYRGDDDPTGIALMAEHIYGGKGVLFWVTQLATFAILSWPPTPPTPISRGCHRSSPATATCHVSSSTVAIGSCSRTESSSWPLLAGVLIVVFKGNISALIPLYAFGVFTGFTLSQAGMVVHHFRVREPRWRASAAINAVGCVATGVVALVVVVSKFTEGAWIPAVLIPVLVVAFRAIGRHYRTVRAAVTVDTTYKPMRRTHSSSSSSARSTTACSTPSSTPGRSPPSD